MGSQKPEGLILPRIGEVTGGQTLSNSRCCSVLLPGRRYPRNTGGNRAGAVRLIFIDSNIPMYLVGAPHVHKFDAQLLLQQAAASGICLVSDAEVIQEILHRHTAINRKDAIEPAMNCLLQLVDEIYPIEKVTFVRASAILLGSSGISARDAVDLAAIEQHGIQTIMSFDAGFDQWPGIRRLYQV